MTYFGVVPRFLCRGPLDPLARTDLPPLWTIREKHKILDVLDAELEKARQRGFVPKHLSENSRNNAKKRLLAMIGIVTTFGHKNNRDVIRKARMPTGAALKIMEEGKGIVIRFLLGRRSI
ncbi:hydroxyproline O-galactosyltransferase HPGT1-like [Primulina huaijiensis]|uniref:hydroxyproline O-galactosyltransferase HPGT1-like n=1 Tax=Primulina huaijiensis TaxID=1492673 RepID=UPI003CC792CB